MPVGAMHDVHVGYLPHSEGEGGLDLVVAARETPRVRLHLFRSPHFAKLDLVGRPFDEVSDTLARCCATSPVSHQITAVRALEAALGVQPSAQTEVLRRIMALAHWIQGHALHIYFLAAPGLLGYRSSFELASVYPEIVQRALRLKRVGTEIEGAVGGRRVAPFGIQVNGFRRLPNRTALDRARLRLEKAKVDVADTIALVRGLTLPSLERETEHIALRNEQHYPVTTGRVVSTGGLDISPDEYGRHIGRRKAESATPGFPYAPGRRPLYAGPLARLNLNRDHLGQGARQALHSCGLTFPCFNPFASVVARAVELVQATDECAALLDSLDLREEDGRFDIAAGEGAAVTESPRGILYHRYRLDSSGVVRDVEIISPTAHNVFSIEEDLRAAAQAGLDLSGDNLKLRLEMLVRSYDPCATCSRDVPGLSLCLNA